jgi:RNA polymerase sigma factor (sigma-70 family)
MMVSPEESVSLNQNRLADVDDFEQLYDALAQAVLRYFYRRTGSADLAADLTAETFASALSSLETYRSAKGTPEQWLFGIAGNQMARFLRRRRVDSEARHRLGMRRDIDLDSESRQRIEDLVDLRAEIGQLQKALEALSPKVAEAVRLRVGHELSYAEVADELGISEMAARARVSRGLTQLAEKLEEES